VAAVVVVDPAVLLAAARNLYALRPTVAFVTLSVVVAEPAKGAVSVTFIHAVPPSVDTCH
jgi:hypothetical protein